MAAERKRPGLTGEVVSTEDVFDGDEIAGSDVEIHTWDPYPVGNEPIKDDKGNVIGLKPSAPLQAAIDAGHVLKGVYKRVKKMVDGKETFELKKESDTKTVEIRVEDKDGNLVKIFRQDFTPLLAINRQGAIVLPGIDGDETELWDMVSASANQGVFSGVYVDMKNASSGPEKAIKRLQKILGGMTAEQKLVALKELGLVDSEG